MSDEAEQLCLFDPDLKSGRTCPERSPRQAARISGRCSKKPYELRMADCQFLDLRTGAGNLLGVCWETNSPLPGEYWTLNTGPAPHNGGGVSTLSQILQARVHPKYYLSRAACLGILRRAEVRGKDLPESLRAALRIQAGLDLPSDTETGASEPFVFHINQREETIDLGDIAGALMATDRFPTRAWRSGSRRERSRSETSELSPSGGSEGYGACGDAQMQTFIAAGFSAGAGSSAGSIAYGEELVPALKSCSGGNRTPAVLRPNDWGGERTDLSEDICGMLRADEKGRQPLLFDNHGIDARYTGPQTVAPTMSARYGTGGSNLPLVAQTPDTRDSAVFTRQRVDVFRGDTVASTESARQHKDATDLVCQRLTGAALLIRRLTPLECERLQGYADGWTAIPGAADSARYKALGNSVAIPCVEYIMRGIAYFLRKGA